MLDLGLAIVLTSFWILMIWDCVRNERDRHWLWILIFFNVIGAVIYFLARVLTRQAIKTPGPVKQWVSRDKLWNAEAATRNIGNSHQFLVYGDLLRNVGKYDQALIAYTQALLKDEKNLYAHWGVASITCQQKDYVRARPHLETILKGDRDFKYGSASLLYGQTLYALEDWPSAKQHLQEDYHYWSHPEAALLLGQLQIRDQELQEARATLESMIAKVNSSPRYHYQRHVGNVRQAKKLLKTLKLSP